MRFTILAFLLSIVVFVFAAPIDSFPVEIIQRRQCPSCGTGKSDPINQRPIRPLPPLPPHKPLPPRPPPRPLPRPPQQGNPSHKPSITIPQPHKKR